MWVYRRVTGLLDDPVKERTWFEVGYVAAREGPEYDARPVFHCVEQHTVAMYGGLTMAESAARAAVHYLNGGDRE